MNLFERARNILVQPGREWRVIAEERGAASDLFRRYVIPLAAIGPLASIIGLSFFGITIPLTGTTRVPLASSIGQAAVSFALSIAGVYVLALIIDALAPTFGGQKGHDQALKVAAYSGTPGWLGGIFLVHPSLALLSVLCGVYGLYLLYRGLPALMRSPAERAIGYTVVVVLCAIVLSVVIGLIATALFPGPRLAG
jgi:hypothetical protein